jgi:hypothetical protein
VGLPATDRPIFIVGFPRSGTTLLHGLVGAHSRIAAPPEMHFFSRVVRHRAYWGSLDDESAVRRVVTAIVDSERLALCGFDVDALTERAMATDRSLASVFRAVMKDFANREGKARWCEKTPMQSAALVWGNFPDAQVIHLIRDPRDSVASSLELMSGSQAAALARSWHNFTMRNVRDGAARGPRDYLRVRYEDLARDPEAVLTVLFAFLGEEFDPGVLDPGRRRTVLSPVVISWQQNVLGPIKPPESGAWRQRMNWHERARTSAVVAPLIGPLGYDEPAPRTVLVGRALNAASAPVDWMRRRRLARAMRRLRTPELRYETAMRNWRRVHDPGVADWSAGDARSTDPYGWFGVWSA